MKNQPAFPCISKITYNSGKVEQLETGMSKRFFAACMAMQGLLASKQFLTARKVCEEAYSYADELIKQERDDLGENQ